MRSLLGLDAASAWSHVVRGAPASAILGYLRTKWEDFVTLYSGIGVPLAERNEPTLTEGLAAYLAKECERGNQPFDGEFFCELSRFDLQRDGTRRIIGRTDIEWRLSGFPNFIVEFKIIGAGRPASKYVADGMARFVDGRYGARVGEGAMWAFFQPNSPHTIGHIEAHIDEHSASLRCVSFNGAIRIAPSTLAPQTASFDSLHERNAPAPNIRLAHVFVDLPD